MHLEDMLEFCGDVLAFTTGHDGESLRRDAMRLDATLRKLSLIGEAATRIPEAIRARAPDIPWRRIVAARNRVMHAYQGIDMSAVWSMISKDVPALQASLRALLDRL